MHCCDLSQLWYREFYLEMTMGKRIQVSRRPLAAFLFRFPLWGSAVGCGSLVAGHIATLLCVSLFRCLSSCWGGGAGLSLLVVFLPPLCLIGAVLCAKQTQNPTRPQTHQQKCCVQHQHNEECKDVVTLEKRIQVIRVPCRTPTNPPNHQPPNHRKKNKHSNKRTRPECFLACRYHRLPLLTVHRRCSLIASMVSAFMMTSQPGRSS